MADTAETNAILPPAEGELPAASNSPALDFFDPGSDFDFSAVENSAAISSNPQHDDSAATPPVSEVGVDTVDSPLPSPPPVGTPALVADVIAAGRPDNFNPPTDSVIGSVSGHSDQSDGSLASLSSLWTGVEREVPASADAPDPGSGPLLMCGCPACLAARNQTGDQPAAEAVPAALGEAPGGPAAATAPGYATSALLVGSKWGSTAAGTGATVTYSFLNSVPSYYPTNAEERVHFVPMNGTQAQAAREALAMYAEVANIQFVEVAAGTGTINFGTADLGAGIGGWAYYPDSDPVGGDVWITNRYSEYNNPVKGSWEYQTFIHEIGHAIGMKHPGNYDAGGGGTPGPYLPTAEDNHQYTVMSYYSGPSYGNTEPITPQLYDVATIQYLYGVNTNTRSGNDTYTFSTSREVKTIWDGGGTDTFNASNQNASVTIDLRQGAFSSIAGTNNVAIAYGATIEVAIGSNFNDTLRGNDAGTTLIGGGGVDTLLGGAGADKLVGSSGRDTLTGNAGADIFSFASGDSSAASGAHDLITDFILGTDLIDLSDIDADISTSGIRDRFHWLATAAFDGLAGALDYLFDAARGVTVVRGDVNGDNTADFAIDLSGNLTLTTAHFTAASIRIAVPLNLTGTAGNDTLIGDDLADTLSGLGGDDTLDGRGGADSLIGGLGNDIYVVDNAGDVVTENAGEGTDTVRTTLASYTLQADVENLVGIALTGQSLTGNALANAITGGSGADTISGGAGNDTIVGGANSDKVLYASVRADYLIVWSQVTQSFTVTDQRAGTPDGVDTVSGTELFQFSNGTVDAISLTMQTVVNGDGSRTETVYDAGGSNLWSSQVSEYTSSGQLRLLTAYNDDGGRSVTEYDLGGQFSWIDQTTSYDGLGRTTFTSVHLDTGYRLNTTFDVASQYSWSSFQAYYDPLGRHVSDDTYYRNGMHGYQVWDPTNQYSWSYSANFYDGAGRKTEENLDSDDGTHSRWNFDTQNLGSWAVSYTFFDSNWNKIFEETTWDNGTQTKVMISSARSAPSAPVIVDGDGLDIRPLERPFGSTATPGDGVPVWQADMSWAGAAGHDTGGFAQNLPDGSWAEWLARPDHHDSWMI
jgi:Ca2+-binding RTX toxin-like protein